MQSGSGGGDAGTIPLVEHLAFRADSPESVAARLRNFWSTIYTVGLDIPKSELETRRVLKGLAEENGGRAFFVKEAKELGPIYDAIQKELRSRYLRSPTSRPTRRAS